MESKIDLLGTAKLTKIGTKKAHYKVGLLGLLWYRYFTGRGALATPIFP